MTLTLATQRLLAGLDHGPAPQLTAHAYCLRAK